ncbi:hypothetical protein Tsubulata_047817 [Turnera subulata]|uniref:NADH:ubiquinone oxidoreductase intermediate-associated protein 30 domain-containing protein n=1 Tax=Turnera subulata TaxID=218843 RepID=A0A9Q0F2Q9_9ROSI|nr:hypothetical protein Tsubulata_047817 [Turnera subulata]
MKTTLIGLYYVVSFLQSRGISKRGLRFLIIIKPLYRGLFPGGGCPEASSGGGDGGCAIDMSRFRGLLQASVNATKKAFTWNLEELMPPSEKLIFSFNSKDDLKNWHLYSDSEYGGLSSASLEITDAGNEAKGVFSGNLSLDVADDTKWNITRSGFCGMRSKKVNFMCKVSRECSEDV